MPKPTSFLVALAAVAVVTACADSGGDPTQPAALSSTSDSTPTATSVTAECPAIGESSAPGTSAPAREPLDLTNVEIQGIAVAPDGSVFVPDATDSRILRVSKAGTITHFAGQPEFHGFEGDCGPARNARLNHPLGLAVDTAGALYITDHLNHRVRKVDQKRMITTVAGSENSGFAGDGGPATKATLQEPVAVAVDRSGRIYIADRDNMRVRVVGTDGTITTLAGNGLTDPERTEGPATEAALGSPVGVATGMDSVVYISDELAHRVYRVGADGVVTTFAGTGEAGYSGDGGPATAAQLSEPNGLATDPRGNLYIADLKNHVVRVVNGKGVIRTVAGTGTAGSAGDGRRATKAQLQDPFAVALDHSGALYIADSGNRRVRRVDAAGKISTIFP
jgi:sugar lactone lactonase YvrE